MNCVQVTNVVIKENRAAVHKIDCISQKKHNAAAAADD